MRIGFIILKMVSVLVEIIGEEIVFVFRELILFIYVGVFCVLSKIVFIEK